MKQKLKEYTTTFKKVWADERGRALIKLGFFMIFILFATSTITSTYKLYNTDDEDTIVTSNDAIKNYSNLSDYSANYIVDGITYFYTSANKQIIRINDASYFIEDGNLVDILDATLTVPTFEFKFWYLTPSFIYNLIQNGEELYTTTYADESIETSYLVPLEYFASTYDGNVLAIDDNEVLANKNIEIVTTKVDESIVKVKINLSTYYVLINNQITNYNIEIDYE